MSRVDAEPRPDGATPSRMSVTERAQRIRFRRAMSLVGMTLLIPGSAQFVAGRRALGAAVMTVWAGLVALLLLGLGAAAVWHGFAFWVATTGWVLGLLRLLLIVLGIGWAALFVDAWRLGQPLGLLRQHRVAAAGVNGFLSVAVAGALLFGAHLVNVQKNFMDAMFGGGEVVGAHDGRFNILLLGGDSGADRWGLRPDSMNVASIDARTGKTVLISLPRNMQNFPFRPGSTMDKQFPDGFDCDGCYLNGVSTWAQDHTDLFKKADNPGVKATVQAIEGITGLRINYWAMVNMAGFSRLVDAVGGVELNVRDRIPVGGLGSDVTGYIEPGVRTLDGHDTLWFARAREGSDDYSRMARQKCVMSAMLSQISPQKALTNFEKIAKASSAMISTSVPSGEVDTFLQLALKAKSQKIGTVSLVPPMINTADPDIDLVHRKVAEAIDRSEGRTPARKPAKPKSTPGQTDQAGQADQSGESTSTGGSLGTRNEGYAANQSEDLGAAC